MHRPACLFVLVAFLAGGWLFLYEPSAVAGTPAYCADNREVTPHVRMLASAGSTSSEKCTRALLRIGRSKLRFYAHHQWVLSPRYAHSWNVPSVKRRNLARKGRAEVRYYTAAVAWAQNELAKIEFARWLLRGFTCIHHGEGAWNANTGNGYYGGLQMNYGFMQHYGSEYLHQWGTADNWPAWAQIDASVRAYRSGRGFYPWPNTSANCGLPKAPLHVLSFAV